MISPGWYHAKGDPVGSQRYWDGTQWQGEVHLPAAQEQVVYYAPAEAEVDLGDVATRVSLNETDPTTVYAQSPYSVSTASVNVTRRKPLPESLKNLTVLVCALKSIPLLLLTLRTVSVITDSAISGRSAGRFAPPGLDFNSGFAAALFVTIAFLAFGVMLVITQARAALKDQASNLFAIGLIMLVIDVLNTATQWVRFADGLSSGATVLTTVTLVLQGLVTSWAGIQSRRT